MKSSLLHSYAVTVAAATFILIIAGGLVTSTGSGLSVPDWPLSYGGLFPPMIGGIRFEHTHRLIAGLVGILTFALSIGLYLNDTRTWVKAMALTASFGIVLQAILGGLTVKYLLPTIVSVLHACLAQTFFCLVAVLALVTSREWAEAPVFESEEASSLHRLLGVTTIFVYFQLIAGAWVRHSSGRGLAVHFVLAFLILLHVLLALSKTSRFETGRPKLQWQVFFLGILVMMQLFLGLGAFVLTQRIPPDQAGLAKVILTTAHQANGALILMTCVVLTMRSYRFYKWIR